ncbi:MAG: hypothetical protein R2781_09005 [Flavobacteriaceae bacterium]
MKKKFLIVALVFSMFLAFAACSEGNDPAPFTPNTTSADQTAQVVESGDWRITSFIDSGQDETSDFTGYIFTFNENGTVTATKGNETISGTWSISDSNNNSSSDDDGNSIDDDDFNLFFSVSPDSNFEDLNDDWDFISVSNTKIELIDISGGNGGTDYLTFEKN